MASKKQAGSSRNGRDSRGQRLGVKVYGDQHVTAGNIILKQRGTKYAAGENVYVSKDHSLHAAIDGLVQFAKVTKRAFTGRLSKIQVVSVRPNVAKK